MVIKVLKTEADYEAALSAIDELIDLDPDFDTPEAEKLDLLTLLVREYESERYQIPLPDPIDAIRFRMEQQHLKQRDLIPFIGSRGKVSEVLARKRPLTLSMIRALHAGLAIPVEVLIQEDDQATKTQEISWTRFPLREMIKRGWIQGDVEDVRTQAEEMVRRYFSPLSSLVFSEVLYRKSQHVRSARTVDEYALAAWAGHVIIRSLQNSPSKEFVPGILDLEFLRKIARLSVSEDGPLLARDMLNANGISLIIEPHLRGTHLDGAAIMIQMDRPIIGLTLRYDRIDNFWFCLMHELAHLALHLGKETAQFFDDLDLERQDDPREIAADEFAGEALIPQEAWEKSPASLLKSSDAAEHLAKQLKIHPAIVAGRMRHEFKAYRLLSNLVGYRQVRRLFPEHSWDK
jgi:HTH-type transcriptional regulator/antitoxin HigA